MTKDNDLDEAPRKAAGTALRHRRSIDAAIGQVDHLTVSIKAQEMNTSISEMIENTRAVALSPSIQQAIDSIKALQIDPVVIDLANSINMHQEAMRLAIEPFASIKQPLVFEELELIKTQFSEMTHIAEQFQERFRMPELGEAAKLAAEYP